MPTSDIAANTPISSPNGHAGPAHDLTCESDLADLADEVFRNETLDVLVRARALIAEPKHWCRYTYGRTLFWIPVSEHSLFATRWCATGAIRRAACAVGASARVGRIKWGIESRLMNGAKLERFNDSRTHADVLELFDRRIAELEKTP